MNFTKLADVVAHHIDVNKKTIDDTCYFIISIKDNTCIIPTMLYGWSNTWQNAVKGIPQYQYFIHQNELNINISTYTDSILFQRDMIKLGFIIGIIEITPILKRLVETKTTRPYHK
jgi:hypothetical protein